MPNQKSNKEKLIKVLLWVSIVVLILIGLYVLKMVGGKTLIRISNAFKSVFIPFSIAFFLSFIIGPLATVFERKLHIKRSISIIIAIVLGLIVIIGLLAFVLINLVIQMSSIFSSLVNMIDVGWIRTILDAVNVFIDSYLSNTNISELLEQLATNGFSIDHMLDVFGSLVVFVTNLTSSIFQAIMILILTPVFLFYLIKEKTYIFTGINQVFPEKLQPHFEALGQRTDTSVRNYLKGQGIMIGLIASYFAVMLVILSFFVPSFGVEMAILFALIMGLFNIVPYVGAWIGLSLPIIYLLTMHLESSQTSNSVDIYMIAIIIVLVLQVIEQAIESSIVQPLVLGNKVQIHPLLVLSSLLFFGGIFGFVGVLLAVPMAATLKSSLEYFKSLNQSNVKKTT